MKKLQVVWWKRDGVARALPMVVISALMVVTLAVFGFQSPSDGALATCFSFQMAWHLVWMLVALQEGVEIHEDGLLVRRTGESRWISWRRIVSIDHRPLSTSRTRIILDDGKDVPFCFSTFFERSYDDIVAQVIEELERRRGTSDADPALAMGDVAGAVAVL